MGLDKESATVYPRRLIILAVAVSVLCIVLIILHAMYPQQYSIDTTTIALIIILVFPWLLPYIKTLKLPGGTEITFKDEVQKLERLSQKSKISFAQPSLPTAVPSYSQLLATDPNLALASLRIEIERKLREIARKPHLQVAEDRLSLKQVLDVLHSKRIIKSPEFEILDVTIDVCNRAVHAEKVDKASASEILSIGESALSYLNSMIK